MSGLPVRDFRYVGFGSTYYVDFVVMHRFLGITAMLSIEKSEGISRRLKFNKPFGFIELDNRSAGEVLPTLDRDQGHIVWLDYDTALTSEVIEDVVTCTSILCAGSIVIVTVSAEPKQLTKPIEWQTYYSDIADRFVDPRWSVATFKKSNLPNVARDIIFAAAKSGSLPRKKCNIRPLLSFKYNDSIDMCSFGFMIASPEEDRILQSSDLGSTSYARLNLTDDPFHIYVPAITRKERLTLDSHLPCAGDWAPEEFELPKRDLDAYAQLFPFFPDFGEIAI